MPAVSVIIPVYKSEKCLEKAVNSVLNQSFSDFEILLVDDGSPDNSLALCQKLSSQDPRIKALHKENGGICSARNFGIDHASGKYIAFLDHDDEYMPGYLEENLALLEKYEADYVKFGKIYRRFDDDGSVNDFHDEKMLKVLPFEDGVVVYSGDEIRKNYTLIRKAVKNMFIWDGIYRADLIKDNQIRFDTSFKYGHEDNMFNIDVIEKAGKIVFNSKEYFIHNYTQISTSSQFKPARIDDAIKTAAAEKNLLMKWGIPEVDILQGFMDEFYRVLFILYLGRKDLKYKQKKEFILRFRSETVAKLPNVRKSIKELYKKEKMSAMLAFCLHHKWVLCITIMFNAYHRFIG